MTSPLAGKRIVNTRAVHQAAELDALLSERGAIPLAYPCLAIAPGRTAELERTLIQLFDGGFAWLIVTSTNAVAALADRIAALGLTPPVPPPYAVAAVGPATAVAVERLLQVGASVVPAVHRADQLANAVALNRGDRVLLPQSEIAEPLLEQSLTERGAKVTAVSAYRTVTGQGGVDLPAQLGANEVDALVFASASAVDGLVERLGASDGDPALARELPAACIGPATARAARRHGFTNISVALQQTLPSAIDVLELAFTPKE